MMIRGVLTIGLFFSGRRYLVNTPSGAALETAIGILP
jgi:hypothetical protein